MKVTELETFVWISTPEPMQCLHLSLAPAPSLNPPISCEPRLSPETNATVPLSECLSPFKINWCPAS